MLHGRQMALIVECVIAYVFDLCCGHNPCSVVYDPANIRDHLAMCLKDCRVRQFPVLCDREYAPSGKIVTSVELHCSCRMPEFDGDRMVCCDLCGTWYHKHCMDIPEEVFDDENIEWLCKKWTDVHVFLLYPHALLDMCSCVCGWIAMVL